MVFDGSIWRSQTSEGGAVTVSTVCDEACAVFFSKGRLSEPGRGTSVNLTLNIQDIVLTPAPNETRITAPSENPENWNMTMINVVARSEWGMRNQNLTDCAERIARMMGALSRVSDIFKNWRTPASTKRAALSREAIDFSDIDSVAARLQRGVLRTDIGRQIIAQAGNRLHLWNGENGDRSATISIVCNASIQNIDHPNHVSLKIRLDLESLNRITQKLILFDCLVEPWDADLGLIYNRDSPRINHRSYFLDVSLFLSEGIATQDFGEIPLEYEKLKIGNGTLFLT